MSVKSVQLKKEPSEEQEQRNEKLDQGIIEPDKKQDDEAEDKALDFNLQEIV